MLICFSSIGNHVCSLHACIWAERCKECGKNVENVWNISHPWIIRYAAAYKNVCCVKECEKCGNVWNISHLWIITYAAAYKALSLVPTRASPSHTKLTPLQNYDDHRHRHRKHRRHRHCHRHCHCHRHHHRHRHDNHRRWWVGEKKGAHQYINCL